MHGLLSFPAFFRKYDLDRSSFLRCIMSSFLYGVLIPQLAVGHITVDGKLSVTQKGNDVSSTEAKVAMVVHPDGIVQNLGFRQTHAEISGTMYNASVFETKWTQHLGDASWFDDPCPKINDFKSEVTTWLQTAQNPSDAAVF